MYLFQICWATQQSSHVPPGICTSALQRTRLWIIDLHDWFKTIFAGFFSTNYIKKRCISVIMYRWWWLCRNKVLSSSLRWQKCPQWCHWCGYFSMKSPGRQPFSACTLCHCACLISSGQDADYKETVQACTYILLCVRDSMAVHLPPQHHRYAQSHYFAPHFNRIVSRFLLQYCSMYAASLETDGNRSRDADFFPPYSL